MPRSFELAFFTDRNGRLCCSLTTPSGERLKPRLLGEVAKAACRFLAAYLGGADGIEWTRPGPAAEDEQDGWESDVRTFGEER